MTGSQMLYEFRLGFDIIASGATLGFTDTQVYSLLNRSQDYIIDSLIERGIYEYFNSIIITDESLSVFYTGNVIRGLLPTALWKFISAKVRLTKSGFSTTGIIKSVTGEREEKVNIISQDEFEKIDKETGYTGTDSYTYFETPFGTFTTYSDDNTTDVLRVKGDSYSTITRMYVTYLKKRKDISASQSCELMEKIHRKIVDQAIDIAKDIINIQEPQSKQ